MFWYLKSLHAIISNNLNITYHIRSYPRWNERINAPLREGVEEGIIKDTGVSGSISVMVKILSLLVVEVRCHLEAAKLGPFHLVESVVVVPALIHTNSTIALLILLIVLVFI